MRNLLLRTGLVCVATASACADGASNLPMASSNARAAATATPKAGDAHADADDAPRITLAEAKKDFDAGNAVFIDTRSAETFKLDHIKGALNIATADAAAKADTIPKGKKIIAYCS